MPFFKVRCFKAAVWDGVKPRIIEARDEQEAAERACGGPLAKAGQFGQLHAEVWPESKPREKTMFFVPPQPIQH